MLGIVERSLRAGIILAGLTAASPAVARDATPYFPVGAEVEAPRGFTAMCETDPALCPTSVYVTSPVNSVADRISTDSGIRFRSFDSPGNAKMQPGRLFAGITPTPITGWRVLVIDTIAIAIGAKNKLVGTMSFVADPRVLRRINSRVNRSVRQISDADQFGQSDVWRPTGLTHTAAGDCEDFALEKQAALIAAGVPANALRLAVGYSRRAGLHTVLIARTWRGDVVLDSRTSAIRPWSRTPYVWLTVQSASDPRRWYSTTRGETLAGVQYRTPNS
jgi:predicted transglutaminase-like cysteine proteinase